MNTTYQPMQLGSIKDIAKLNFGFSFIGNKRTIKLRYNHLLAEAVLKHLPIHHHSKIMFYKTHDKLTKKGNYQAPMIFLAAIEESSSFFWTALEKAINMAKAELLRKQADLLDPRITASISTKIEQAPINLTADDDDSELPF
jgi:hypothetical protein